MLRQQTESSAQRKRPTKLLALGLIVPAALVLSACEGSTDFNIHEDGRVTMNFEFSDDSGLAKEAGITCADMEESFTGSGVPLGTDMAKITDNSSGDTIACMIELDSISSAVDGETLVETDDTFIFNIEGDGTMADEDLAVIEAMGITFTMNVTMPGDIIEAEGASINGNTATYNDFSAFTEGATVEGYKTADGSGGGNTDPDEDETDDPVASGEGDEGDAKPVEDEGSSKLPWIIGGSVGALVILGGLLAFFLTRKKGDDPYGNPPYGGPGYGGPGQQGYPGQHPYGAPQQYGQAPQQYGQPGQQPYGAPQQYGQAPQQYGQPNPNGQAPNGSNSAGPAN